MIAFAGSQLQLTGVRSHVRSKSKIVATLHQTSQKPTAEHASTTRRAALLSGIAALSMGSAMVLPKPTIALEESPPSPPPASSFSVLSTEEGDGTATAQISDLVLVHYVGRLKDGTIFDSTRGGLNYRDGGEGKFRPVSIKLGGDPMPGITKGLETAILGMRINGKRTVSVPAELGFGSTTVLAPYAVVPPWSTIEYEIELVRLSRRGPDALLTGVTQCGGGFVMERTKGCGDITPAEYL